MKKSLLLLLFIIFITNLTKASHIVGGDIRVEWVSQNQYKIYANVFRDDVNGTAAMPNSLNVGIYEVGTNNLLNTINVPRTSIGFLNLGDECFNPDSNTLKIEEGVFESSTFNIPDFAAGYYLQTEIFARNNTITNLDYASGNIGMSFFAMIPDPSLGENSSPIFGEYPPDSYFCINASKDFNFNVTDPDGDSLVYSLVDPLNSVQPASSTPPASYAGTGAYPYYPSVDWAGGYDLTNIVGGTPPMSIDPITGIITAAPNLIGTFVFAVRVEEFRNGVKIGETRRDIQYTVLNCTVGNPPKLLNSVPVMNQTIEITYNIEYCKDLIFDDQNITDTLFIEMISPIFDSGAYIAKLTPDANGNLTYFYNFNGTSWNDNVMIPPNTFDNTVGAERNIGTIANRFCWTPQCNHIGLTFPFEAKAFSLGCDGRSQDSISFNIEIIPPPDGLNLIPNVFTPNGDGMNDTYKIDGISNPCNDELLVEIYDRWGKLVYESVEPTFEWDGTNKGGNDVPNGTYFVIIKGRFGSEWIEWQRTSELEKRTITLLR